MELDCALQALWQQESLFDGYLMEAVKSGAF